MPGSGLVRQVKDLKRFRLIPLSSAVSKMITIPAGCTCTRRLMAYCLEQTLVTCCLIKVFVTCCLVKALVDLFLDTSQYNDSVPSH